MNRVASKASESAENPLRKPVNTLAIVPTKSSKITVLARKAYNVLLYIAQEQGIDQEVYRSPLKDILRGVDFNSNAREIVKQHLRAMVSTTVEWQSPTAGEGDAWNVAGLLAHAKVYKQGGENWVEWSFAPNIKHELLEPQRFARLRLDVISQLRRHSGVVLYEICSRYKDVGQTARQPWPWWRPVLTGSPDTEDSAKQEYRFFKRDVLKLAIAEVNAVTDLEVELIEHKAGRFISDIQFKVLKKQQEALPLRHPPVPIDLSQVVRATAMGVRTEDAEALIHSHGNEAMATALDALQKRVASEFPEPLRDPSRYLRALLESSSAAAAKKQVETGKPAEVTAATATAALEGWTAEWISRRRAMVLEEFDALSTDEQAKWVERLRTHLYERGAHPSIRKRLETSGWKHPMVAGELIRFFKGPDWDKPTSQELLAIAAQRGGR
ncbi:replication initiation protein [Pseudaquabacterium pictum]|uniref:Replication protein n=1 Tax=Pseudaquabacterium pictum TaxID=2315236 RepID=A0A480AVK6_9BURK|nr:replication initiation protein [Rubrivivax pictus]GCL65534.1 replication protein [Rubrivivax pictus]